MNTTAPRGERLIIALAGRTNTGKSSLINALTGQEISIVSPEPGTTTDPVDKSYELLPLGPVTFVDTAGLDDLSSLGAERVKRSLKVLWRSDITLFVADQTGLSDGDWRLLADLKSRKIPVLVAFNKGDIALPPAEAEEFCRANGITCLRVSALEGRGVREVKEAMVSLVPSEYVRENPLVGDLVEAGQWVVLVVPIDLAAPKGRLILPQVQVLRDLLDQDALAVVVKERELERVVESLGEEISLVITDSQAVLKVAGDLPESVKMTTFSILMARYKGELSAFAKGAEVLDRLKSGDAVLIAEACSHHQQADDIGRVKIPRWIRQYTGLSLRFDFAQGMDFPESLEEYSLVVQCGGCMLTRREMLRRIEECRRRGVEITNYGVLLSKVQGLLDRVMEPFGENR